MLEASKSALLLFFNGFRVGTFAANMKASDLSRLHTRHVHDGLGPEQLGVEVLDRIPFKSAKSLKPGWNSSHLKIASEILPPRG